MKATEAAYIVLLRLKIIIGLLKFRIFCSSRKDQVRFTFFRQTDKKTSTHQPIKIYVKNFATDGASYQTIFLG
jgi:hypothetical protein